MNRNVLPMLVFALSLAVIASGCKGGSAKDAKQKAEGICPVVADHFGKVFTAECQFVDTEGPRLCEYVKVFTVDGKVLESPIVIGYHARGERPKVGVKYRMRAYETLYSVGTPLDWKEEPPSQFGFCICNELVIGDLKELSADSGTP